MSKIKKSENVRLPRDNIRPDEKKEASPSEGEYFEYITLSKNDSIENVGPRQESLPERRSEERKASTAVHSVESISSNMHDLGLPSRFSQRKRGQGQDRSFACTVCKVTLTSVVTACPKWQIWF